MKFTIIQKYIKVKNKDPDASGGFKTLYIQNLSSSLEPNTEYQMLLKLRENSSRYTAGPVYTINFRTENIINADEISIDSEKDIKILGEIINLIEWYMVIYMYRYSVMQKNWDMRHFGREKKSYKLR